MKEALYPFFLFILLILPDSKAKAQTCQALFEYTQWPNTLTVQFSDLSISEFLITSWSWDFGDGATSIFPNPEHTYDHAGEYDVCLTIIDADGCLSNICHTISLQAISLQCHSGFAYNLNPNTSQVAFTDQSISPDTINSWTWDFGDGNTSDIQNPVHDYPAFGNYYACLTIQDDNNCQSVSCHHIIVDSIPETCHASFTSQQIAGSYEFQFIDGSESSNQIISWLWDFGDGQTSTFQFPTHTYSHAGDYIVCLLIADEDGCQSQLCHIVDVNEIHFDCDAFFNFHQGPGTLDVDFFDASTSSASIESWSWYFGEGGTSVLQNPSYSYAQPGVYLVCLSIIDELGCEDTFCQYINVEGAGIACQAAFTWITVPDSLNVVFIDTSSSLNQIISWLWDFGDGEISTLQNPDHVYSQPGEYFVCLTIRDELGCESHHCVHVDAGLPAEPCHAEFHTVPSGELFTIHFNDASSSDHTVNTWFWNFGDGENSTLQNPTHTYPNEGTYEVCLFIGDSDGCHDTICHNVIVHPPLPCQAAFHSHKDQDGDVVYFNNTSTGTTGNTIWLWDFGDGQTSNEENPQHIYAEPGIYDVCLFITDSVANCASHFCHPVTYHTGFLHSDPHYAIETHQTHIHQSRSTGQDFKLIRLTNPVMEEILLEYDNPSGAAVTVEIFDLNGENRFRESTAGNLTGNHKVIIRTDDLWSGMYIFTITSDDIRITRNVTVVK